MREEEKTNKQITTSKTKKWLDSCSWQGKFLGVGIDRERGIRIWDFSRHYQIANICLLICPLIIYLRALFPHNLANTGFIKFFLSTGRWKMVLHYIGIGQFSMFYMTFVFFFLVNYVIPSSPYVLLRSIFLLLIRKNALWISHFISHLGFCLFVYVLFWFCFHHIEF